MRTAIFKSAITIAEKGLVKYTGLARDSLYFDVLDEHVEIRTTLNGTTLNCTCQHCSLHPNVLCCRKLAVLKHYMDYKDRRKKENGKRKNKI